MHKANINARQLLAILKQNKAGAAEPDPDRDYSTNNRLLKMADYISNLLIRITE